MESIATNFSFLDKAKPPSTTASELKDVTAGPKIAAPAGLQILNESRGRRRANLGMKLVIVCGIAWLMISNTATIYGLTQVAGMQRAMRQGSLGGLSSNSREPSYVMVWLLSTSGQLSVVGVVAGTAMMIVGYAELFLAKQSVFEQHVNEQMNVVAAATNLQLAQGETTMGDQINVGGHAIGSALGRGASAYSKTIHVVTEGVNNSRKLNKEQKEVLSKAAAEIPNLPVPDADKEDVAQNLKQCAEELDKPNPEPSRVVRFINRIGEVAPTIVTILKSAASIAAMIPV